MYINEDILFISLYRFISTFLTKAACFRNIEVVLHLTAFWAIYIYIYICTCNLKRRCSMKMKEDITTKAFENSCVFLLWCAGDRCK